MLHNIYQDHRGCIPVFQTAGGVERRADKLTAAVIVHYYTMGPRDGSQDSPGAMSRDHSIEGARHTRASQVKFSQGDRMDGNSSDAFILEEDPSVGSSVDAHAQELEVPAGSGTLPIRSERLSAPKLGTQERASRRSGANLWTVFPFKHDIPPRAAHSCDTLPNGLVVVFGGWNGSDALNDLHILEVKTASWYQIEAACPPTRRNNHASAVVGSLLFIHGGHDGSRWLQDFFYIDLSLLVDRGRKSVGVVLEEAAGQFTWVQPNCGGRSPRPRACHTLSRLRRKLYMFGGYDGSHCFNEIDILNLDTMTWTLATVNGTIPEGRNAHTMTVYNTSLYLCGGHAGKHHMTDLFVFETQSRTWKEVPATGTWPPGLRGHSASLVGEHLVLIGGYDGKFRNDDIYILDIPALRWTRLVENGEPYCSRQRHSTTSIAPKKLFIFGGFNGATWMSDGLIFDASAIMCASLDKNIVRMAQKMQTLLEKADFCDVTFRVGPENREVRAHKCILAAQSAYFRAMFAGSLAEKDAAVIDMPSHPYEAFRNLLSFLYTGRMHETEDCNLLCDTLMLADHFAYDELSETCQRELGALINCRNVCSLLRRADKAMAAGLKRKCLNFVFDNADEVTK